MKVHTPVNRPRGRPPVQVITSPGICCTRTRTMRFPPVRVRILIVPPLRSSPAMCVMPESQTV